MQAAPVFPTDEKSMSIAFREYMEQEAGIRAIGQKTQSMTPEDILKQISDCKAEDRRRKAALVPATYIPPGGWKSFDADTLAAKPPGKPDPAEKAKTLTNISKYRELTKPRVWDSAMVPAASLQKVLWRTCKPDGSGKRIFSLSREAYPKDIPAQWKPGSFDQDLPPAGLDLVTDSFREMLVKHVESVPLKVSKDLKALPARSTNERNFKSRVSGELASLEMSRDYVLEGLVRAQREAKEREDRLAAFAASKKEKEKEKERGKGKGKGNGKSTHS
jgi:hypothetical protein